MAAWRVAAAALCAAVLLPVPAAGQAGQVWASQDGGSALELRAFYKTLASGICFQPGLVQGTEALADVLDEARLAQPDRPLPESTRLPACGANWTHTARTWSRLLLKKRVEVSAGWQIAGTWASDSALLGGSVLGGGLPVAGTQAATRRFVDFDHVLVETDSFLLQHNLDLLAVKVMLPKGEIVVGRQVLSWGTGRFWNPTDLLSPFAPTDVDREVRHGVDAVRLSLPLGNTSLLDVLYLPQQDGWAQGGVVRVQGNLHKFDVSASVAKYMRDLVFGADTAGDLGPVGIHAEAAFTTVLSDLGPQPVVELETRFLRAVAGMDWRPAKDWVLSAEYYFNGYGASAPAGYAGRLRSDRVARGEIAGAGRHYLGFTALWRATELLSLQTLVVSNLADPSAVLIPVVEDWARQRVIVRVGGYVPLGARPDPSELERLTVSDVLTLSPAFVLATSSFGLRSEYGSSPWGLFAQVGVYF